jgi:hypothetical protein
MKRKPSTIGSTGSDSKSPVELTHEQFATLSALLFSLSENDIRRIIRDWGGSDEDCEMAGRNLYSLYKIFNS